MPATEHNPQTGGGPAQRRQPLPRWQRWGSVPCIALIRLYQYTLSPFMGGQCRYYPTCSHYGVEAFREHGPVRGGWLTLLRLLRCNPFVKGGYDPVPPRENAPIDDADGPRG